MPGSRTGLMPARRGSTTTVTFLHLHVQGLHLAHRSTRVNYGKNMRSEHGMTQHLPITLWNTRRAGPQIPLHCKSLRACAIFLSQPLTLSKHLSLIKHCCFFLIAVTRDTEDGAPQCAYTPRRRRVREAACLGHSRPLLNGSRLPRCPGNGPMVGTRHCRSWAETCTLSARSALGLRNLHRSPWSQPEGHS